MARKSPKCPPTVEPNQSGCIWSFNGMFDHHHHHHGRPHRKLLSFDEQLRSINVSTHLLTFILDIKQLIDI